MDWIVTLKPAQAGAGPHLVSDHPAVVRAVLRAIRRYYMPPEREDCERVLQLVPRDDSASGERVSDGPR